MRASRKTIATFLGAALAAWALGDAPRGSARADEGAPEASGFRLVVPLHDQGGELAAVRYDSASGRTWYAVRTRMTTFREVTEASQVAPGSYQVEVALHEDNVVQMVRLEARTGRCWHAYGVVREVPPPEFDPEEEEEPPPPAPPDPNEGKWVEISEPEAAPSRAAPATGADAAPYFLRQTSTASALVVARCRRDTGQSWMVYGGGWRAIADPSPPGAGAYDLALSKHPEKDLQFALRFDALTGRTWLSPDEKTWVLAPEGEVPPPPANGSADSYAWFVGRGIGRVFPMRYHPPSGRLWALHDRWVLTGEEGPVSPGEYEFRLVPGGPKVAATPLRLDPRRGRLWRSRDEKGWTLVDAGIEEAAAAASSGSPRFGVTVAGSGADARVLRFDRLRGEARMLDAEGRLALVSEPTPLPQGDYAFELLASGTGRLFAGRVERRTGRWWIAVDGAWHEVQGLPKPLAAGGVARFHQTWVPTHEHAAGAWFEQTRGAVRVWAPTEPNYGSWSADRYDEYVEVPPQGEYSLHLATFGGAATGTYGTQLRFERKTGRTWQSDVTVEHRWIWREIP